MKFHLTYQARALELLPQPVDKGLVARAAPAADAQFQILDPVSLPQMNEGLDQGIEPFLTAHPGKVTQDRRITRGRARSSGALPLVALQVDAVRQYANA